MKNENGVIAIYSRKSKFTGKGESIGNQVDMCKEYVRLHYGEKAFEAAVLSDADLFAVSVPEVGTGMAGFLVYKAAGHAVGTHSDPGTVLQLHGDPGCQGRLV